jgi:hypothetical protein
MPEKQLRNAGWIFMKFDIRQSYKNCEAVFSFHLDKTVAIVTLHEDLHVFLPISGV